MTEYVKSKISAFNFVIKRKRKWSFLQADVIFHVLSHINGLPYDRSSSTGRNRKIGDGHLVLDIIDMPTQLSEAGTIINFFIGRETRENYPTRDNRGNFHTHRLPEEENLCFKTHGCFLFKKVNGLWVCSLLFERRFHTLGLARLIKYLEKIKPEYSFEASAISTVPNIIRKIRNISELKSVIIKDQDIDFGQGQGMGTILVRDRENRQFCARKIEIAVVQWDTAIEKITNLFRAYYGNTKQFDENSLREFALENELVLIAKTPNGKEYKVDLFADLILYKLKVLKLDSREIDSNDFFNKISQVLSQPEKEKLLKISRKFYDSIQIEDALQTS